MKKSRILLGICISAMFLIPAGANATIIISEKPQSTNILSYTSCYIEASGKISEKDWFAIIRLPNMWKTFWFRPPSNELKAFVSFWRIVYDSNSIIKIYTKQNGKLLWEQNGKQDVNLVIVWFNGVYIPKTTLDGRLHVEISGNAMFIKQKYIRN
jgi:hypothetical protein